MLGAYLTYGFTKVGLPVYAAVAASTAGMAVVGLIVERLVLRPLEKAPVVAIMAVTLGILIFIRAVCLIVWGPDRIASPRLFPGGAGDVFGIFLICHYLAPVTLSIGLILGFLSFFRVTS